MKKYSKSILNEVNLTSDDKHDNADMSEIPLLL